MTDYQKVRQDFETQSAITYDSAGKLKKKDIQELKSFANPPKMVKDILSLLMPILDPKVNIKKIEYNDCQKLMANPLALVQRLQSIEFDKVTPQQYKKVKGMYDKLDSHDPNQYKKVSMVCSSCCEYVTAWI